MKQAEEQTEEFQTGTYPCINLINTEQNTLDSSKKLINSSELIINATGYNSKSIEVIDANGMEIKFAKRGGSILTNYTCNPIINNGEVLPNFYTYGLGAGLTTGDGNGGEQDYAGRIDGVWVYQHEVSNRIVDLLGK
jgi:hypothetical protein